jgi:hypothetical protein
LYANSPTCYRGEAAANLLNLFDRISCSLGANGASNVFQFGGGESKNLHLFFVPNTPTPPRAPFIERPLLDEETAKPRFISLQPIEPQVPAFEADQIEVRRVNTRKISPKVTS